MSKLNQKELLEWFKEEVSKYAFLQTTHPHLAQKATKKDEQAYQQIKEMLLKPEITKEWMEEKVREMMEIFSSRACKDFIRSLVEEIHGRKEDKL